MAESEKIYDFRFKFLRHFLDFGNAKTLEVGSRTAGDSALISLSGGKAFCLDYQKPALLEGKQTFERHCAKGFFVVGNALALPFRDSSFELVFNAGVLEHFKPGKQDTIVMEMSRVSKRLVSIFVPQTFHRYTTMQQRLLEKKRAERSAEPWEFFEKPMTIFELASLAKRNSLRMVDFTGSTPRLGFFPRLERFLKKYFGSFFGVEIGIVSKKKPR